MNHIAMTEWQHPELWDKYQVPIKSVFMEFSIHSTECSPRATRPGMAMLIIHSDI